MKIFIERSERFLLQIRFYHESISSRARASELPDWATRWRILLCFYSSRARRYLIWVVRLVISECFLEICTQGGRLGKGWSEIFYKFSREVGG